MTKLGIDDIVNEAIKTLDEKLQGELSEAQVDDIIKTTLTKAFQYSNSPATKQKALYFKLSLYLHPDKNTSAHANYLAQHNWTRNPQSILNNIKDGPSIIQTFVKQASQHATPYEMNGFEFIRNIWRTQQRYPEPIKSFLSILVAVITITVVITLVIVVATTLLITLVAAEAPIFGLLILSNTLTRGELNNTIDTLKEMHHNFSATRLTARTLYSTITATLPTDTIVQTITSILKRVLLASVAIPIISLTAAANLELWLIENVIPFLRFASIILAGIIVGFGLLSILTINAPLYVKDYVLSQYNQGDRPHEEPESDYNQKPGAPEPDVKRDAFYNPPHARTAKCDAASPRAQTAPSVSQ